MTYNDLYDYLIYNTEALTMRKSPLIRATKIILTKAQKAFIQKEVRECRELNMPYTMYCGYMEQAVKQPFVSMLTVSEMVYTPDFRGRDYLVNI